MVIIFRATSARLLRLSPKSPMPGRRISLAPCGSGVMGVRPTPSAAIRLLELPKMASPNTSNRITPKARKAMDMMDWLLDGNLYINRYRNI